MNIKTLLQKIAGNKQRKNRLYWFNYDTEKWDLDSGQMPKDLTPYLPVIISARNLFILLQETGMSPIDAYLDVMHQLAGIDPTSFEEEE